MRTDAHGRFERTGLTMREPGALPALLASVALVTTLAACTASPASTPTPTETSAADAAGDSCVPSPETVATTDLPAGAMEPVDDETADRLRLAAEEGLGLTSAPGAIVAVRSPEGTWVDAFGEADLASGSPMTVDDFIRVGSITKTFTSSLVLQLVEAGDLSLDDTIDEYVEGVPNGDQITIRMLLDMTSGIASYTLDEDVANTYLTDPTTEWTPDQLLAAGLGIDPLFAPGAQFNYSNTNYILLGKVIEDLTGQSYPDVLQTQILDPLEFADTSFPGTSEIPVPYASGISLQGTPDDSQEPIDATDWSPTFAWTAGQIISTIDDMLRWGRILVTGQGILDDEKRVERLNSFPEGGGYGFGIGCLGGWVGHTGEIPGYNTTVYHDTTSDTTVVVMANSDIPSGGCSVSKTLADNDTVVPCMAPAVRIFASITDELGHPFEPIPMQ